MTRIITLLVGVLLVPLIVSGGSSSAAQAAPGAVSLLRDCPSLKRGQSDPVDGHDCVRELQTVLRQQGYDQRVTGEFAERTEANVKDFQRHNNIEAIGVVGPKTRAALLGDTPAIRDVPPPDYATDRCTPQRCDLYVSRTSTGRYAQLIADHPLATTVVTAMILRGACAKIFRLSVVTIVCHIVTQRQIRTLKTTLAAAARQHACLRISLGIPLAFATDNTSRCKD